MPVLLVLAGLHVVMGHVFVVVLLAMQRQIYATMEHVNAEVPEEHVMQTPEFQPVWMLLA